MTSETPDAGRHEDAAPGRLTAAALAEAAVMVAAPVYGIEAAPPDPAVPPADLTAALVALIGTVLDTLPDRGIRWLATAGAVIAAIEAQEGSDHDQL